MAQRQARLRSEYAEWYPGMTAGVWHNAVWLAEVVMQRRRRAAPSWALEGRPLPDEHFEFQGVGPAQGKHPPKRRNLGSGS
jgi:hypothetical protein